MTSCHVDGRLDVRFDIIYVHGLNIWQLPRSSQEAFRLVRADTWWVLLVGELARVDQGARWLRRLEALPQRLDANLPQPRGQLGEQLVE